MAVNPIPSSRQETITFTGDVPASLLFSAAANPTSPASIDIYSLAAGNNTITLPTGGSTPKAAVILPPVGNAQTITLKGVAGDTGILINKLDPTTITFDTPPANFVLTAGGIITGLRIVWV
jgi:hypothetical protein